MNLFVSINNVLLQLQYPPEGYVSTECAYGKYLGYKNFFSVLILPNMHSDQLYHTLNANIYNKFLMIMDNGEVIFIIFTT